MTGQSKINANHNKVSTTERQWLTLSYIQRGKWIGTVYIQEQLRLAGFQISLRTVQRDLVALSKRFLIEHNNSNPQGWRWKDEAPLQSLPNMNLSQAMAFSMVEENLAQLIPPAILKDLYPWFDLAKKQLKSSNTMQSWLSKVRIEPATLSLISPNINIEIKNDIYHAVFEQEQIKATYHKPNAEEASIYYLNPLALIQRGTVIYLLATKSDDQDNQQKIEHIRKFTLHRFEKVELLETSATIPDEFNLDSYIESGAMGFYDNRFNDLPNKGKNTQVTLTFAKHIEISLRENPLSIDQEIYTDNENTISVQATINLNKQLIWWLRGFGKDLISAEPIRLWQVVKDLPID